jgi:hypothetical protein
VKKLMPIGNVSCNTISGGCRPKLRSNADSSATPKSKYLNAQVHHDRDHQEPLAPSLVSGSADRIAQQPVGGGRREDQRQKTRTPLRVKEVARQQQKPQPEPHARREQPRRGEHDRQKYRVSQRVEPNDVVSALEQLGEGRGGQGARA